MEGRKVQKVGYSTITVSLPSKWVKQNKIRPGDLVFVSIEKDGTLRIMPSQIALREEAEEYIINADACSEPGMVERIIIGSYILGRDVIRVSSQSRIRGECVHEIRRIVRKLIGLGILEETPNHILLQCSIDPTKFKLDMLIRRLAVVASTILSDALQALVEGNYAMAEEAISREDEADMIYYLAVRLLLSAQMKPDIAEQIGATDTRFIPAIRLILQYLELVADYSEDIAREVLELKIYRDKVPKDLIKTIFDIGEMTRTILDKAVDCLFTGDIKVANSLLQLKETIEIECNKFLQVAPVVPHLRSIVSTLQKIADKGATIAEIAINRSLETRGKGVDEILRVVKHVRQLPVAKFTKG